MRYAMVTLAVHAEGEQYVADCVELGTSSYGASMQEALVNVREATLLFLNKLDELGECRRVLQEQGVAIVDGGAARTRIECPPDSQVYSQVIPLEPAVACAHEGSSPATRSLPLSSEQALSPGRAKRRASGGNRPLAKHDIPLGTFRAILHQAGPSYEEFLGPAMIRRR